MGFRFKILVWDSGLRMRFYIQGWNKIWDSGLGFRFWIQFCHLGLVFSFKSQVWDSGFGFRLMIHACDSGLGVRF